MIALFCTSQKRNDSGKILKLPRTIFAHGVSIGDLLRKRNDQSGFIHGAKFFDELKNCRRRG